MQQFDAENHLRWDSLGEFLALCVSLEDVAEKTGNSRARCWRRRSTMPPAASSKRTSRRRGRPVSPTSRERFYLCMYWAQALGAQTEDAELAERFGAFGKTLEENEAAILKELVDCQGDAVDLKGYYHIDRDLADGVRPSRSSTNCWRLPEFVSSGSMRRRRRGPRAPAGARSSFQTPSCTQVSSNERFAGVERPLAVVELQRLLNIRTATGQLDRALVQGQAAGAWAVLFEAVEMRAEPSERLGVARCDRRSGAPAQPGAFLFRSGVRRRVSAEEELLAARGDDGAQGLLVEGTLGDRRAMVVRPHTADNQVVAVDAEAVGGDRRPATRRPLPDLHGVAGGDVLPHDLEHQEVAPERRRICSMNPLRDRT